MPEQRYQGNQNGWRENRYEPPLTEPWGEITTIQPNYLQYDPALSHGRDGGYQGREQSNRLRNEEAGRWGIKAAANGGPPPWSDPAFLKRFAFRPSRVYYNAGQHQAHAGGAGNFHPQVAFDAQNVYSPQFQPPNPYQAQYAFGNPQFGLQAPVSVSYHPGQAPPQHTQPANPHQSKVPICKVQVGRQYRQLAKSDQIQSPTHVNRPDPHPPTPATDHHSAAAPEQARSITTYAKNHTVNRDYLYERGVVFNRNVRFRGTAHLFDIMTFHGPVHFRATATITFNHHPPTFSQAPQFGHAGTAAVSTSSTPLGPHFPRDPFEEKKFVIHKGVVEFAQKSAVVDIFGPSEFYGTTIFESHTTIAAGVFKNAVVFDGARPDNWDTVIAGDPE